MSFELVILIFGLIFLISFLVRRPKIGGKILCIQHKWKYNDEGFLFCEVCCKTTKDIAEEHLSD